MKSYHDRAEACIQHRGTIQLEWGLAERDAGFKAAPESPLPTEDNTPPVTKMNFFRILSPMISSP